MKTIQQNCVSESSEDTRFDCPELPIHGKTMLEALDCLRREALINSFTPNEMGYQNLGRFINLHEAYVRERSQKESKNSSIG